MSEILNPAGWDYICRRNAEVSEWRKAQVRERREQVRPAYEAQMEKRKAWLSELEASKKRLTSLALRLIADGTAIKTQPRQLSIFIGWMEREYVRERDDLTKSVAEYIEELGMSRALFDKQLQRARKLLRAHGACAEDIRVWSKSGRTSGRVEPPSWRKLCEGGE